jgi:hypothetical protein
LATAEERLEIYHRKQELLAQGIRSNAQLVSEFPHIPRNQITKIIVREGRKLEREYYNQPPEPDIVGVGVGEGDLIDEEEVWRLALQKSKKRGEIERRKEHQSISFEHGPVCLVLMADLHLGDTGVRYDRIDDDIETIVETPGMYVVLAGDSINNFIVGRLRDIRFGAEFAVAEEWVLAKRVLKKLAPKLLLSVSGNHELWTYGLTNIDYLRDIHERLNPDILYSRLDSTVAIDVGGCEQKLRVRHKWRGYSQYNLTHGIEWAAKFDKGREFDIGVGAHVHASGVYRQFNNGGKTGHAILCGSYKVTDEFATTLGFPEANESAAVATVFTEHGVWGTNNINVAADYMNTMYLT